MVFVIATVSFLFIFYSAVIIYYYNSWRAMPDYAPPSSKVYHTRFSVIIPARNEEDNIGALLESLGKQTYPKELFEVIVIDDHSTDRTAELVKNFKNVHLLQLTDEGINSYKKKALEKGIALAKNEWIVCTDADCIAPPDWLSNFASLIDHRNPVFIAAPVKLTPTYTNKVKGTSLLYIFQSLDFLTLQGITAASVFSQKHNMCNGANLAYRRDVFYEVAGFKGIDNIASGDDMLLMHKIWKRYPNRVAYLKSPQSIIQTDAAPSWKAFINQRIRWASKATNYDDKRIFAVLLLVYLFNFSFFILAIASFFNIQYLYIFIICWILKTLIEIPFVNSVSRFFNLQKLMKYFLFFQPLHIAYTIIAGFFGSFGKYEWKGRKVK